MARLPVKRSLLFVTALAAAAWGLLTYSRPSVLLVGNVTIDLVDKKPALGGASAYAAAVLSAFGIRACIVTAAGGDADLSAFEGHDLHVVPSNATLTFEHTYTWWGNKRVLRVLAEPNVTLNWNHVPVHCRRARTVLLGPLMPKDIDCQSFVHKTRGWLDGWLGFHQHIGLMAQGLQRSLDATKKVIPVKAPQSSLLEALNSEVYVFLSDVETDIWPQGTVGNLTLQSARWLITRGEHGADEFSHKGMHHLPPYKVDSVADTNGAGDTFATAYMLALQSGWPSPGSFANWAASRAVMMPQDCKPHCVSQGMHANSTFAQVAKWVSGKLQVVEEETQEIVGVAHGGLHQFWNSALGQRAQQIVDRVDRLWHRNKASTNSSIG